MRILAIDFETANASPTSACAVGAVLFEGERILRQYYSLIRTPTEDFRFSDIHKLTWADVADERSFDRVWPDLETVLTAADLVIAHNAKFDRDVLLKTCEHYDLRPPPLRVACTLKLARAAWRQKSHRLPALAKQFEIPLDHHNALSDAMACARIYMRAISEGHAPEAALIAADEPLEDPRPEPHRPEAAPAPAAIQPAAEAAAHRAPVWWRPAVLGLAGVLPAAALLVLP